MIKLSEILEETAKCEVSYGEHTIEVEYYPNRLTPAFLSSEPDALSQIKHLVKWWSIEDENGKVDVENTAEQLPIQLLAKILETLVEKMSLGKEKNKS